MSSVLPHPTPSPETNEQRYLLLLFSFQTIENYSVWEGEGRGKVVCSHSGRSGTCSVFLAVLRKWTEGLTLRCCLKI